MNFKQIIPLIACLTFFLISCSNNQIPSSSSEDTGTNPISAISLTTGTITDQDGNVYNTVSFRLNDRTIEWVVQNWKCTKYRDGSAIPQVTDSNTWKNLTTPAYCWYKNTINNKAYGALYNWYVINPANIKKLGPASDPNYAWHVANDAEWTQLMNFLIQNGYNWDGTKTGNKIAKSVAATWSWLAYPGQTPKPGNPAKDLATNNKSGLSALAGGLRQGGGFNFMGTSCYWWSPNTYNGNTSSWLLMSYEGWPGMPAQALNNFKGGSMPALSKSSGCYVRLMKTGPIF